MILDQIHQVIFKDFRITAKSITEQLRIARDWVGSIIHEDLNMRKLSSKWVPKCLMADQNYQRCHCLSNIWIFRRDPNYFLSQMVTMDDTWLYHFEPEIKKESIELGHSGSPCLVTKNFRLPRFFGIKRAYSSMIIFQRAELSTRSITHLCWCN